MGSAFKNGLIWGRIWKGTLRPLWMNMIKSGQCLQGILISLILRTVCISEGFITSAGFYGRLLRGACGWHRFQQRRVPSLWRGGCLRATTQMWSIVYISHQNKPRSYASYQTSKWILELLTRAKKNKRLNWAIVDAATSKLKHHVISL